MFSLKTAPAKTRSLDSAWSARLADCVISLAFSPQGDMLAVAEASGKVLLYGPESGQKLREIPGHRFGATHVSWRPGSLELATSGQDGKARVWNASDGALITELETGGEWTEKLAYSPSGKYLATCAGKNLKLWDPSGKLLHAWPEHKSTVADIQWMPAGARYPGEVLASCAYGGILFWRPGAGTPFKSVDYKGSMLRILWSPDACHIGTGNQDATIQFWVMPQGIDGPAKDLVMWGYRSKIVDMAWDPKSRYLATGGSATGIVWDCSGKGPAGSKPLLLDFHAQLISELAWQHQGQLLASGCNEGLIALWRPSKGDEKLATAHLAAPVSQLLWSPDDKFLAAGTEDGQLQLFRGFENGPWKQQ